MPSSALGRRVSPGVRQVLQRSSGSEGDRALGVAFGLSVGAPTLLEQVPAARGPTGRGGDDLRCGQGGSHLRTV